jgi:prepilin-type N-terminal cleavage/methylation domain-containing protein
MHNRQRTGFTIVELLVVVSIIALLIGILLPAIGKARDQARLTISQTNLRQLAVAHASYSAEWGDAQLSLADYNLSRYGNSPSQALAGFEQANGAAHAPTMLGWGHADNGDYAIWGFFYWGGGNAEVVQAIDFNSLWGWFRMPNVQSFNQYLGGRFYDPVFYAPKDRVVMAELEPWLSSPDEFVPTDVTGQVIYSSYCLSPAALYGPAVLANDNVMHANGETGFQDPFDIAAGLRTPAMSQARFSDLKTHMIEHHWLQGARADCNASIEGNYDGCEPFYFNHSIDSYPVTLFYDGHIENLGVQRAQEADSRNLQQAGYGLWHRGTPAGSAGYFGAEAYDFRADNASFHIFTTDGILGRDFAAK